MAVSTGLEVWSRNQFAPLRRRRVGLLVNPTSVDSEFRHLSERLKQAPDVTLAALFGPEHGVSGHAQYMEAVGSDSPEPNHGIPVYSLYGHTFESLSPKLEWLRNLDALVFDMQDVGSRYYTYVYTLALSMKAAAAAKVPVFVLDRPNPIGGEEMEGNLIEEGYTSFVGLYPLPNRHGMTVGELARYFNEEHQLGAELNVVPMEGWRRSQLWQDTGLPFIPPSPNMPTADTALVYPGMCLLEGTNLSEGRGTCRPFELFGAPWLRSSDVLQRLAALGLPGVKFRAAHFVPTFDKFKGEGCHGAMIHVVDKRRFRPLATALGILGVCRELSEGRFAWRKDAYEFVEHIPAIDLLCGNNRIRAGIDAGWPLEKLTAGFDDDVRRFAAKRKKYLLYE
jgi:uncharacterized protein YbbC (DUF1343 family)